MTDTAWMTNCIRACGEMLPEPPSDFVSVGFLEALEIIKAFEPMTEKLTRWGELWETSMKGQDHE